VEKYVEKRGPLYKNGYNEARFSFLPIKKAAIPSLNHKWELACPFNEKATLTNPPLLKWDLILLSPKVGYRYLVAAGWKSKFNSPIFSCILDDTGYS
jgi:hypothetical protein